MIDEHRRGACENMPGCHTTDVLVEIWKRLKPKTRRVLEASL